MRTSWDGDLHRCTSVDVLPLYGMQVLVSLWGRCAGVKMAVRRASARAGCRAVVGWSGCGVAWVLAGCWWLPADAGISLWDVSRYASLAPGPLSFGSRTVAFEHAGQILVPDLRPPGIRRVS